MSGFVLISLPYLSRRVIDSDFYKVGFLFISSVLLFLSIYALNSYFGFFSDQENPRFKDGLFDRPQDYLFLSVLTGVAGLLGFYFLGSLVMLLAFIVFGLWALYSCPGGAKGRPIFGTGIHIIGQVIQFHLGVCSFSFPSVRTFLISGFFALLFSSGHLLHEQRDYRSDRSAQISTNAVYFGLKRMHYAYKTSLFVVFLYWITMYLLQLISLQHFLPFLFATGTHLLLVALGVPRDPVSSTWYQRFYRTLYFSAGVVTFLL